MGESQIPVVSVYQEAVKEKIFLAEKNIAYVRGLVILINTISYLLMVSFSGGTTLAYAVIFLVWPYGLYLIIFRPYRKYSIFLTSYFTYLSDAVFTNIWLWATGGFHSPYYILWYISIIAVAFRFSYRVTLASCTIYAVSYILLVWCLGDLHGNEVELGLRCGFIYVMGLLGIYITKETFSQTHSKLLMQRKAEKAIGEEALLQEKVKERTNELEKSLGRFRRLIESIPQMAWTASPNGDITFINKPLIDYTGVGDLKNWNWKKHVHVEEQDLSWQKWTDALTSGEQYEMEYRWMRHNGEYRWMLGRANPVLDEDGKLEFWIGTVTDIHDRKTLTEMLEERVEARTQQLNEANKELERSNDELLQFASVTSHDLKEPLRKVQTFASLLLTRYGQAFDEKARDYMMKINNSCIRMRRLIEDLLEFSRLSNQPRADVFIDMNILIEDILHDLEIVINETHAIITVEPLPQLKINSSTLRQVFQNLISNSLKFCRPKVTPKVHISSVVVPKSQVPFEDAGFERYCMIKVEDNGIGFEEKHAKKIFSVFQRLHTSEEYEGTGIGLTICKKIIENHEGKIIANSIPGKGSVFTIYLPFVEQ